MDKFLKLMIPDFTSERSSGTPPNENEIRSPTSYLLRLKSRKFWQRTSLQFDTIVEISENQMDLNVSSIDSAQEENNSNSSIDKDLDEFKIYMINQRTDHSSPKLVGSHFEDSGFLNCSIEMTSNLETISEVNSPQEDEPAGHEVLFDSYFLGSGEDHSNSWLKVDENLAMNREFIANSGEQNCDKYSSNDKFIPEVINVDHDSQSGDEL